MRVFETRATFRTRRAKYRSIETRANWYKIWYTTSSVVRAKPSEIWSGRRDLNPRPSDYKSLITDNQELIPSATKHYELVFSVSCENDITHHLAWSVQVVGIPVGIPGENRRPPKLHRLGTSYDAVPAASSAAHCPCPHSQAIDGRSATLSQYSLQYLPFAVVQLQPGCAHFPTVVSAMTNLLALVQYHGGVPRAIVDSEF